MTSRVPPAPLPAMGYGDFMRFEKLVYDRFGLHFSDKRQADLERGVRQAFAASPCADLNEYYSLLLQPERGTIYLEQLVNAITISESYFFRNAAQFDALYQTVLPEIIRRRRTLRTLRIWSAGCANGEEPYSIAMLLRELLPDIDDWTITILATDVNTEVLDRARKGSYSAWAFREARAHLWRQRYFRTDGQRFLLDPQILRMVTFRRLNLAGDSFPAYETNTMFMDLILCRNVMIYFSNPVMQAMVNRFYESLVDSGWLVVGHSEHSLSLFHRYETVSFPGAILYQRAQPGLPPAPAAATNWHKPLPAAAPTPTIPLPPPIPAADQDSLERARELLEHGRFQAANDMLHRLTNCPHPPAQACALLGQIYADKGSWDLAEKCCRQAIAEDRLCLPAYYTLALVHQHCRRFDSALELMKKVVYLDRQHVLAHFSLAELYHACEQPGPALKSLENAMRLLEAYQPEDLLPGSGGITVERLRQTIVMQQQQWSHAQ